ncbi:hypothetical protein SAMN05421670_0857 [Psychrobacillus psychrotolerans]|uniref:Uncharacterized protein n=1 Tax=Psychrobacillus psychrotolerans TaxID=126156 RepID=A0A1I5VK54_9BACI|nr:hypothetical protein [Psychrobacillus psychrotolerans]SFQ07885.1 hypothetical protein SAMN05421670_0857 [Psychrobacillus psychrotolerans]
MKNKVIEQYEADENMMIQIYVQWCINHDINPLELYNRAYPNQASNNVILELMETTEKNSTIIDTGTVLDVLQLFGNDDLAYVVSEEDKK